jgi:hypothetical protein
MHRVLRAERCGDGINVIWKNRGIEVFLWFSSSRLMDIGVDDLDLLEHPGNYVFDEEDRMLAPVMQET